MRFIVIGAGGVGGCFGGELARVGHDVTMYARGAHLEAIRTNGLTVRVPDGEFVARVNATDDIASLPEADVALVAVKSYSLRDVMPVAKAAALHGAHVLPLLNGVTAGDDLIAGGVPSANVLGGIARISAARVAPGVVERRSDFQSMVVGELAGGMSDRVTTIAETFRRAQIDARASANMPVELWQKFIFITAMAAVCGMSRTSIGPIRTARGGHRLIRRAVAEVASVGIARGVAIPPDEVDKTTKYIIETLPPEMKPSFLLDLEAGGETELDTLSGTVARLAAEYGIECPIHETAAAVLSVRP